MTKKLVVVGMLVIAFIANPSKDAHVAAAMKKQLPYGVFGESDNMLSMLLHAGLKNEIKYSNCVFFSLASFPKGDGPITVGAFGFVKAF